MRDRIFITIRRFLLKQISRLCLWVFLGAVALLLAPPSSRVLSQEELTELDEDGWNDDGPHLDFSLDRDA